MLTLIAVLLCGAVAFAGETGERRLQESVARFQSQVRPCQKEVGPALKPIQQSFVAAEGSSRRIYVASTGSGFFTIWNEKDRYEVVAYTCEGEFQGMSDIPKPMSNYFRSLLSWAGERSVRTKSDRQDHVEKYALAPPHVRERLLSEKSANDVYGPLLEAGWHQGDPFNKFCPLRDPLDTTNTNRRVVGCVATGHAQVINYWRYPLEIKMTDDDQYSITDESDNAIDFDASADDFGFPTFDVINENLDHILYNGNEDEIGYLNFATGLKLKSYYSATGGTSSWFQDGQPLRDLGFGSVSFKILGEPTDSEAAWEWFSEYVIENIKIGWPVPIGIPGHVVVIDGYDSVNDMYGINWGWGGAEVWAIIPMAGKNIYDVLYDVSGYFVGWSQHGGDSRLAKFTPYRVMETPPALKWKVTADALISRFQERSIDHGLTEIVTGGGGLSFASLWISTYSKAVTHIKPYVAVVTDVGTLRMVVPVGGLGADAAPPVQSMAYSSHNQLLYLITGKTSSTWTIWTFDGKAHSVPESIFSLDSPNSIVGPLHIDENGNLFFVVDEGGSSGPLLYSLTPQGATRWTASFVPADSEIRSVSVDNTVNLVYVAGYAGTTERCIVETFNKETGYLLTSFAKGPYSDSDACPTDLAIDRDGLVYAHIGDTLYQLEGGTLQVLSQATIVEPTSYADKLLSIGIDGDVYIKTSKQLTGGGKWVPGITKMSADDLTTIWHQDIDVSPSLGQDSEIVDLFSSRNDMVVATIRSLETEELTTVGLKDNGDTVTKLWGRSADALRPIAGNRMVASCDDGRSICGYLRGRMVLPHPHLPHDLKAAEEDDDYFEDNNPPDPPSNPNPGESSEISGGSVVLSWDGSDPDGQDLTYSLYIFQDDFDPDYPTGALTPYKTGLSEPAFTLEGIEPGRTVMWSVSVSDGLAETFGPIWMLKSAPSSDDDSADDDATDDDADDDATDEQGGDDDDDDGGCCGC